MLPRGAGRKLGVVVAHLERRDAKAPQLGSTERHAGPIHLVLIGIMMRCIDPLVAGARSERLHRNVVPGAQQVKAERPWSRTRPALTRWPDQHIAPEPAQIRDRNGPAAAGHRIPEHHSGRGAFGLGAGSIGNISGDLIQAGACYFRGEVPSIIQAELDTSSHGVTGGSRERVMKFALKQGAPGVVQQRPTIAPPHRLGQCREWLCHSAEREFDQ